MGSMFRPTSCLASITVTLTWNDTIHQFTSANRNNLWTVLLCPIEITKMWTFNENEFFFFLWQPTGKNWAWMIMSISTSGRVDVKNNLSIYACRTFQILKTVYMFPSTSQVWATSWILCKILILDTEVCGCNIRKFDKRLLGCKYFSKSLAELSGFTYLVIHGSSRAGLHLDVWLWSEELHMINKPK